MRRWHVLHGKNLDILPRLASESVDSIVTDPPAGIDFMGADWDRFTSAEERSGARGPFVRFLTEVFTECFRILKPGGHVVVWALPRTAHWTTWAIEDAGFEIRDRVHDLAAGDKWLHRFFETLEPHQADLLRRLIESQASPFVAHLFGSGFPKSADVSKAIDKEMYVHALFDRVRDHLVFWKEKRGLSNADLNKAVGSSTSGSGMAGHWTAEKTSQPEIPSVEQWRKLKAILKWPDCDLDRIYEAAKKGKPRPVVGKHKAGFEFAPGRGGESSEAGDITAPASDVAAWWAGWGTALKPAIEPWIVARKPLVGTVARNVMKHGTGAMNVSGCRVAAPGEKIENHARVAPADTAFARSGWSEPQETHQTEGQKLGRHPPNLVLSHAPGCRRAGVVTVASDTGYPARRGRGGVATAGHSGQDELTEHRPGAELVEAWECVPGCPVAVLDVQSGKRVPSGAAKAGRPAKECEGKGATYYQKKGNGALHADSGTASRFFPQFHSFVYVAKPTTKAKAEGLDERNPHPTVKGVDLMRWLIRLVTPAGGRVLDPFGGSGSTGVAALAEGCSVVLIEKEAEFVEVIRKRLEHASLQGET